MKLYKKFWLCVLAVVLLCICALPQTAHAAGENNVTVSVSANKTAYYRGDTVTVTVSTPAVDHCVAGGFLFAFNTDVFDYLLQPEQPLLHCQTSSHRHE